MPIKPPKRRKEDDLDKDIAKVKNPFQAILVVLSHPKLLIPVSIILIIVLAFMTIRVTYKDGSFMRQKSEIKMHKAIERVEKLKEVLKN